VKRNQSRRSRQGATLGDALSPTMKKQLQRLRDTLEKQAREAIGNQLAAVPPPWRRQREKEIALEPPRAKNPTHASGRSHVVAGRRPTERQVLAILSKTERRKTPKAAPKRKKKSEVAPKPRTVQEVVPKPDKEAFEYWEFPSEAAVRESPPASISGEARSNFDAVLGTRADPTTDVGEELHFILGLDFGTSSTKMIVRLPYEAGQPTIAIPAPETCRSGDHPYLWQTVLWLTKDGTFHPWPERGATVLNSLKQGLIQGRSDEKVSNVGASTSVTRAQAGAAYLALAIRYARGWLLRNRPNLFRGRKAVWFVNIGMPTASHDDPSIVKPYRCMGAAALLLAGIDSPVTVQATQRFLDDPHVIGAAASEEAAEEMGVVVVPETAAEMTGFAKSTRSAPGLYLLVDVGALTLDACMFHHIQRPVGENGYAFMAAAVRPLGVESFHWFLSEGKTESDFKRQCDRTLRAVVWDTKKRRDIYDECWRPGNDLPVFLAGGGATHDVHRDIVETLDPWLRQHTGNEGIRRLELSTPRAIELPEPLADFGRMAVAWGLSYPPTEIGRIQPMRDIADIPPPVTADLNTRLVSKDDV